VSDLEYPRTLADFDRQLATEEQCRAFLVSLRWPGGFRCPRCSSREAWPTERNLMHCRQCGRQTSVTAGTMFHRTRKPLRTWFQVMWWVSVQKNGTSAVGLQRILGLGGYQTAWSWLHKLRRAMVRPGREPLSGEVEVDETYVGGVRDGGGRRHLGHKALVAIAAEVRGSATGRIRLRSIPNATGPALQSFVRDTVAPGSVLRTDGWASYLGLEAQRYRHRRLVQESSRDASKQLPRVHRVASLLKRWLMGTHQGRVERAHLPYYLDEFTFRFNRRASRSRGLLFLRLAQQAVALDPVHYRHLVGGSSTSSGGHLS